MDVTLSDEEQLLADTVESLARRLGPTSARDLGGPADRDGWRMLADAGLLGLRVPVDAGGSGASGVETMLVAEGLARHLCPQPFVGSAVLGTELLVASGAATEVLEGLAGGRLRVAVGLDATMRRVARLDEPGALAWDADGADAVVLLDDGGRPVTVEAAGTPLDGADLTRGLLRLPDHPRRAGLGDPGGAPTPDAWQRWECLALAVLSADLVGTMEGALAAAVAYSGQRVQFGSHIGAFQAVQHLCAESKVLLESSRSATWYAAWGVDARAPAQALMAARSAKACAGEAAAEVTQNVVQVHGGVAITWETLPHVFLRRSLLSRQTLGDERVQLGLIADDRLGAVG